jgi:hypothetical protein
MIQEDLSCCLIKTVDLSRISFMIVVVAMGGEGKRYLLNTTKSIRETIKRYMYVEQTGPASTTYHAKRIM